MRINEKGLFELPTDQKARELGYYVDLELPNKIIAFAKKFCKIWSDDYSGKAGRELDINSIPWQAALIKTLYGWRRPNGNFRFVEASCWIPRRQGKSLITALCCCFQLFQSNRQSIPVIASTIEESRAVYDRCVDFIKSHPALEKRCHFNNTSKKIKDIKTGSEIVVLSSNKVGKLGKSIQLFAADELAAWPNHSARDVWNSIHDSLKDKVNAIKLSISTPQFDLTTLGREKWLECKKLLDGVNDNLHLLPVIYQANDKWKDDIEKALREACPSLNLTTPLQIYLDEWKTIQNNPMELARFETMNLGRWVGSPEIWIPPSVWSKCKTDFNEDNLANETWEKKVIGIDWGASYDLTAVTLILQRGEAYYLLPRFFIPEEIAQERTDQDHFNYIQLAQEPKNHIYLTPGNVVDGQFVMSVIEKDWNKFNPQEIRFDPTKMALVSEMFNQRGWPRKEVSTSNKTMSPAFELFERLAREEKLKHNGNPCSDWCLNNCRPQRDNRDNLTIQKSGNHNKIDFADSVAIGLTAWITQDQFTVPEGNSVAFVC